MSRSFILLFILSATLLYGQLDSNTITVNASRITSLQPDEIVFVVSVSGDINSSLDGVVAALAGSGITAADFSGVTALPLLPPALGSSTVPLPPLT